MWVNKYMVFENLVNRISPFVLNEKYYEYSIPTKDVNSQSLDLAKSKKYIMYDFYVLDYLKFLVDQMPPKQFRDLPPDLENSVQDAVNKLFPYLREELLNGVFYAICAELRHGEYSRANRDVFKDNPKFDKLYNTYLKYTKYHSSTERDQEDLKTLYNVRKPSSEIRTPTTELKNDNSRNISFKAANYAINKLGLSRNDFVEASKILYDQGTWAPSYGGKAWARICNGWMILNASDKIFPHTKQSLDSMVKPMGVAIDHVYDLQHNTDTVFNKLRSYYSVNNGYQWIKQALDHKANVRSYYDLLQHTSGAIKSMSLPILYNRLGTTWESDIKQSNPSKLHTPKTETPKSFIPLVLPVSDDNKKVSDHTLDGDKVTKDNINIGDHVISLVYEACGLTIGKTYVVEGSHYECIVITGDHGKTLTKYFHKFKKVNNQQPFETIDTEDEDLKGVDLSKVDLSKYDIKDINSVSELKRGDKLLVTNKILKLTRFNIKPGVIVTYVGPYGESNRYISVELNGKVSNGFLIKRFKKLVLKNDSEPNNQQPSETIDNENDGVDLSKYDIKDINSVSELKRGDKLLGTDLHGIFRKNIKSGVIVTYVGPYKGGPYKGEGFKSSIHIDVELNGKVSKGFNIKSFKKLVPKNIETVSEPSDIKDRRKYVQDKDYHSWKKGDKILCVDASGWGRGKLKKGKIYELDNPHIEFDGDCIVRIYIDAGPPVTTYAKRFVRLNKDIKI
jgi:hypothetical protein